MIIGTHHPEKYPIGEYTVIDVTDGDYKVHRNVKCLVLRECTFEEWFAGKKHKELNIDDPSFYTTARYFELHTD